MGHVFDLSKSHDVIGHVTIRLPIPLFLLVPHFDQAPTSSLFEDIGPLRLLGRDLDLSRSRDVIVHVTIRLPMLHFLLVTRCDKAPISSFFGDIGP